MMKIRLIALGLLLAYSTATASAGNREDCLQDKDQALAAKACPLYEAELAAQKQKTADQPAAGTQATVQPGTAHFFDQKWRLNPAKSRLNITSVKNHTVSETHRFNGLDGSISPSGAATVKIDLWSLDTSVDIRNVRMRFLFFETFKFPLATITAQLDKAALQSLLANKQVTYPLKLELDLHGVKKKMVTNVVVTKTGSNTVKVASGDPLIVQAGDFNLLPGVEKLSIAAGGFKIEPSATIAFELVFEGGSANVALDAVRTAAADSQKKQKTRILSADECKTRMDVISKTRQIYFKSGSAKIDNVESAPLLDEVAQFFNRCPTVAMKISGHTDSDGGKAYNQHLSERRAAAIADALKGRNVAGKRMSVVGYGYSNPAADNTTKAGKAKNRRIEFQRLDN